MEVSGSNAIFWDFFFVVDVVTSTALGAGDNELKATHVFNELNVFNSYINWLPGSASPFGYYYFTFNIFFVFNFCRARVSTNKDSCVVEDEGRVGSLNVE